GEGSRCCESATSPVDPSPALLTSVGTLACGSVGPYNPRCGRVASKWTPRKWMLLSDTQIGDGYGASGGSSSFWNKLEKSLNSAAKLHVGVSSSGGRPAVTAEISPGSVRFALFWGVA